MKDPAFLFYSKDFYEGTRTMLPEERACYVDLMIYQHQNGPIPNNIKRMSMYCSGIDEATLKATLEAKFMLTHEGWINKKLNSVILERQEFTEKQSNNGKVGQFWKKCKLYLDKKSYQKIRQHFENYTNTEIYEEIKNVNLIDGNAKATLEALLKHLADADANENINEDLVKKNKYGESVFLTENEFSKLSEKYGENETIAMIQILDNYKLSKGIKYKSDYYAILNWVVDRYNEKHKQNGKNKGFNSRSDKTQQIITHAAESLAARIGS